MVFGQGNQLFVYFDSPRFLVFCFCDFLILPDLAHEETSRTFVLRPETLLEEDFETIGVARLDFVHHSFVLDFVERTGRVENLSASFQRSESRIEEFGLESRDRVDVLQIPVLHGLRFLESDTLSRAWGIQEYSVESLSQITIPSSVIVGYHDAIVPESLGVLHELCHAVTCRFVGDDDGIWIMF